MRLPWTRDGSEPPLPATYWWLFTGTLISALANFVFPFLALFLTRRGFTVEEAGLTVSAFGAGSLVAGPVAGALADRVGRRPTMLFALLAAGGLAALLPALPAAALAPGIFVFGLVGNAYRPAAGATVADLVPPAQRARAFGLLYWANNLGLAFSMLVGGGLAVLGFGPLFLADAATTLIFAAVVWRRVPESRPAAGGAGPGADPAGDGGYGPVLRDRVLVAFLALHVVFVVVLFQFMVAAPLDMVARGLTAAQYGRVLAVNGLLIALLQPTVTRAASRLDTSTALAAGAVLVGLGFGAYLACAEPWQFALATALWTFGEILTFPTSATLVAALAPASRRGRYQGAYSFSFGIAMLLSPVLGSAVLQRHGSRPLWLLCLAAGLAVAAGHLAAAGARRRRVAQAT